MRILSVGLMIGRPENGFQKAMRKVATGGYMDIQSSTNPDFNSMLVREAKAFQPDLIFMQFQQEGIITEQTAIELAKIAFVMNFSGDIRDILPSWYLKIGRHIHLSTFTNQVDVDRCRLAGVNSAYLEIGIDPTIFTKLNIRKQGPSIVAHFNDYNGMFPLSQYRRDIVSRMKTEFGDDFEVVGNFPGARRNLNTDQKGENLNYNLAKIALNCSHFAWFRYSSDRQLRIMASGTMCLTHHYDGIELDYEVGKHLDLFRDLDEMVEKCRYYLANKEEREQIAQAGYELVHKNFTFDCMCQNIVELYRSY